jgi:hypothetical protein
VASVDRRDIAPAGGGDEGCAAGAGTDIEQASAGARIELIERAPRERVRERLEHLFVHCNVIVPAFGLLVWLELHR